MAQIVVKKDQNIFDLAIQLYGSIEYVYKLIADNPDTLINLEPVDLSGVTINYDAVLFTNVVYFKTNEISITSGSPNYDSGVLQGGGRF